VQQTEANNYCKTEKDHSDQRTNLEAQPKYRANEKNRPGVRHNDHLSTGHSGLPRKRSLFKNGSARFGARLGTINTVVTVQLQLLEIGS
jgi:hypothetical protein